MLTVLVTQSCVVSTFNVCDNARSVTGFKPDRNSPNRGVEPVNRITGRDQVRAAINQFSGTRMLSSSIAHSATISPFLVSSNACRSGCPCPLVLCKYPSSIKYFIEEVMAVRPVESWCARGEIRASPPCARYDRMRSAQAFEQSCMNLVLTILYSYYSIWSTNQGSYRWQL